MTGARGHPRDPSCRSRCARANGILPDRMIAAMADSGLDPPPSPFVESQMQPARLDLRLGDIAYRVRASSCPGRRHVAERIDQLKLHEVVRRRRGAGDHCVCTVPLLESLALPSEIIAAANPKSSTGGLDVFTRVIADGTRRFDMTVLAIMVRSMPRSARRPSRSCCGRGRGCRRSASAPAMPSSVPLSSMRCMIGSGWSIATMPISPMAWR